MKKFTVPVFLLFLVPSAGFAAEPSFLAKARLGEIAVRGSSSSEAFAPTIESKIGIFEYCYNSYNTLREPRSDSLVASFAVGKDGRIESGSSIRIKTTVSDVNLPDCSRQLMKRWRFPPLGTRNELAVTIYFDPVSNTTQGNYVLTPGGGAEFVPSFGGSKLPVSLVKIDIADDPQAEGAKEDLLVVNQALRNLRACYNARRLEIPLLQGEWLIEVRGDKNGYAVIDVLDHGVLIDAQLERCFREQFSTLKFTRLDIPRRYRVRFFPAQV